MTHEDLLKDQAEMQASLAAWQKKIVEIDRIMDDLYTKRSAAEKQIDIHTGHLERLAILIKRLEEQINATNNQ